MAAIPMISDADDDEMALQFDDAERIPLDLKPMGTLTAGLQENVLLTPDSPEDDMIPRITLDGDGNIGVVWTHMMGALLADAGLTYSSDNGATWTSLLFGFEGLAWYADMAYFDGTRYEGPDFEGFWMECLERTTDGGYFALIPDVTDEESWEAYQWTEGSRPGATCLNLEDDMWYYMHYYDYAPGPVVAMINDDQNMNQGLELWWESAGDDLGSIVSNWDAEGGPEGPYQPAQDIETAAVHDADPGWDSEGDFFYVVCQSNLEDNAKVLFKKCIPVVESDIEYAEDSYFIDGGNDAGYDAAHPSVEASGDRVVVIYMANDNVYGDWDIRCKYSSDAGETWDTTSVANEGQVDETYPAVYMSGSTVYVAFEKEGNLYFTESTDGGATWEEPVQMNEEDGTVVSEENAIDIHGSGIVWTDNRNGDKDVYYAPVPAPQLNVESITGGMGVTATVSNTGTEDASSVAWTIDLSGPVFVGSHAEGTIDSLAAGDSETISSGFVLGIGPTTISVAAGGAEQTASGFVLGPLVLGL
ncbi:MAG: hypothetical protein R6U10_05900 [Thermoplasmatota archaeon]